MSESRAIIPLPPSPELTTTASAQDVEALVAQINALDGRVGTLEAEAFEGVVQGTQDALLGVAKRAVEVEADHAPRRRGGRRAGHGASIGRVGLAVVAFA